MATTPIRPSELRPTTPPPTSGLVPINDLAARVGVSRATMWRAVARAGLHHHRLPGERQTYVDLAELVVAVIVGAFRIPSRHRSRI